MHVAFLFFFVAIVSRIAMFALVSTTSTHYNMTIESMNDLEHIAFVRFALQLASAGCLLITISLWAIPFCEWLKSDRK